MPHNRIREFRKAKGLTLDELSERTGISQGHLSRLEGNKRMLLPPVAQKLAGVLGVRAAEILGLDIDDHSAAGLAAAGFSDDCTRFVPPEGDPLARLASDHEYLYRVETDVISRAGLTRGDIARIDIGQAKVDSVQPLQIVLVRLHPQEDFMRPITLLRQFVPPRLLITNAQRDNLPSIDMDEEDAHIVGVVVGTYKSFT